MYLFIVRNYALDEDDRPFKDFSDTIMEQDRQIVESQRPEEIPTDLKDELHLKVPDASGIAYRRLLGRIDQVSWRAMRLLTWDGDTLTVPNNEVARHPLLNHSMPRAPHSRVIAIGVSYHTPPNRVVGALTSMLEQVEGLAETPTSSVRIVGFAESSVTYEIR